MSMVDDFLYQLLTYLPSHTAHFCILILELLLQLRIKLRIQLMIQAMLLFCLKKNILKLLVLSFKHEL